MPSGNVTIEAVAYELPPHRITSASLEEQVADTMERLGLEPGRLEGLTGIRERRLFAYRRFSIKGEPPLTRFLASELALSHHYDISRAKRDFGYQPQFSTAQALERTLPFLRSHALGKTLN